MLIPVATRPAHPKYWPAPRRSPCRSSPGRSRRSPRSPARPPPATARRFLQTGRREPADLSHRRQRVPGRAVQQPLRPVRRAVPGMLGDRPPVALRHLAGQRRYVFSGLLPRFRPGGAYGLSRPISSARFPGRPAQPLSWQQQPPSIHLSSQTHDRQAAALTSHKSLSIPPGQAANGGCPTRAM